MTITPHIENEYDQLEHVLVCPPEYLVQPAQAINAVERHYFTVAPPCIEKAQHEYVCWYEQFASAVPNVHALQPQANMPQQMFTRDVAFVIGERVFVGNLRKAMRRQETAAVKAWLNAQSLDFYEISQGCLEGGDVLVHAPYVFVGIGERSDEAAVQELQSELGDDWQVVPIRLAPGVLHLDCVLTIPSAETIIVCKDLILTQRALLKKVFSDHIAVSTEQVFQMGANVLSIGPRELFVESAQTQLQQELAAREFQVRPVNWTEIRKFGGLFRCASCTLSRKN